MSSATVIKSTDSGVPVCNGVIGQAIVLLDYVLVTRLGWEKVFSGTNKAVYYPQQKGTENRLFYRVDDNYGQGYKLAIYESMSDIDNGVLVRDNMWVGKSYTNDTTARPWVVIGDGYGIYFRSELLPSEYRVNFMGLGNPHFASDAWFSIVTGDYYTSGVGYWSPNSFHNSSLDHRIVWRNKNGGPGITKPSIYNQLGDGWPGVGFPATQNYPWEGALRYTQPVLNDTLLRGNFPGFYSPYHSNGFTDLQEISVDGRNFILLFNLAGGESKMLIDVGTGFRP